MLHTLLEQYTSDKKLAFQTTERQSYHVDHGFDLVDGFFLCDLVVMASSNFVSST